MLRATHINYLHPKHLRVEDGEQHLGWNAAKGFHMVEAVCVAPSCSSYEKLNKPGLPTYPRVRRTGKREAVYQMMRNFV